MANNVFADRPNLAICKPYQNVSFASAGLDNTNIAVIYLIGDTLLSWKPGRTVNGMDGFEENKAYYIVPTRDIDLENIVLTSFAALDTVQSFVITQASPTSATLSWNKTPGAGTYFVKRSTSPSMTSPTNYTVNGEGFTNTGLATSVHYYYQVKAAGPLHYNSVTPAEADITLT